MVKGLKPPVVEVSVRRKIDGACRGTNSWDDALKSITPCVFDVLSVHVRD